MNEAFCKFQVIIRRQRPLRAAAVHLQVPLKYANRSVTGLEYIVSFGIGAALVTTASAAAYSMAAHRLGW